MASRIREFPMVGNDFLWDVCQQLKYTFAVLLIVTGGALCSCLWSYIWVNVILVNIGVGFQQPWKLCIKAPDSNNASLGILAIACASTGVLGIQAITSIMPSLSEELAFCIEPWLVSKQKLGRITSFQALYFMLCSTQNALV